MSRNEILRAVQKLLDMLSFIQNPEVVYVLTGNE